MVVNSDVSVSSGAFYRVIALGNSYGGVRKNRADHYPERPMGRPEGEVLLAGAFSYNKIDGYIVKRGGADPNVAPF